MPTIISIEGGKLLRISPRDPRRLEYSTTQGRAWYDYTFCMNITFRELYEEGNLLMAVTDKGLYVSHNKGRNWVFRHK